jgi:hypothetical protein
MVALPERATLAATFYQHCADAQLSTTLSLSVTGNSSYSFTKTDSVNTTIGGSATATFVGQAGSLSTMLNVSRSLSTSNATTESFSESVTRSQSITLTISPNKQGKFELLVMETTVEVPFSALIIVDGRLVQNSNGISKASELLNESDRSLPFKGVLRITNVSGAYIRTTDVPGAPACSKADIGGIKKDPSVISFPGAALSAGELATFSKPSVQPPGLMKLRLSGSRFSLVAGEGPSIGPADGVSYQVMYISEVIHPAAQCGFNDLSIPNNGVFTMEAREYTSYLNGTLIARWQDHVETFKSCRPV